MDNGLEQAASYLRNARRVAVLTGAGVSKESGVPTYRDALTGLWSRYSFEELASPEGFQRNPAAVWTWYTERREQLAHVEPNPGHIALAQFEALFERWDLITQNVDDLHERAGSARVCHLHGRLMETKCFADCRGAPTLIAPGSVRQRRAAPADLSVLRQLAAAQRGLVRRDAGLERPDYRSGRGGRMRCHARRRDIRLGVPGGQLAEHCCAERGGRD
jgi:NAD-dependent protein deacetylases, SIR2 family